MCMHVCILGLTGICMYVCMSVCMHVCMYVNTRVHVCLASDKLPNSVGRCTRVEYAKVGMCDHPFIDVVDYAKFIVQSQYSHKLLGHCCEADDKWKAD